jgi:tetratricopeptide (TPR) repeat protein
MDTPSNEPWKELEEDADRLWEEAFSATKIRGMKQSRQQAQASYDKAYKILMAQPSMPLVQARLCQKRARCYRKLDKNSRRARHELKEASLLLQNLPADDPAVQIQKAQIEVEQAYLDVKRRRFAKAQVGAEAAISLCLEPPVKGMEESWQILGDAYNLLGIVLDAKEGMVSSLCSGPEECWGEATTNYSIAGGDAGQRGIRDVVIQQAVRLQRQGDYIQALRLLKDVRDELTPERKLVVDNNMIDMYFQTEDYLRAYGKAKELLEEIQDADDMEGLIFARELLLKAICDTIPILAESEFAKYLKEAKECYDQGLKFLLSITDSRDTAPDRIELHRVMIETYLHAGDLESAERVLDEARGEPGFPPEDPDWTATMVSLKDAQTTHSSLAAVRDLLLAAFTAEDLGRLVLYTANTALGPLRDEFGPSDGLATMIDKTIIYCHKRGLLPVLLDEVKEANPSQYRRFASRLRM